MKIHHLRPMTHNNAIPLKKMYKKEGWFDGLSDEEITALKAKLEASMKSKRVKGSGSEQDFGCSEEKFEHIEEGLADALNQTAVLDDGLQ